MVDGVTDGWDACFGAVTRRKQTGLPSLNTDGYFGCNLKADGIQDLTAWGEDLVSKRMIDGGELVSKRMIEEDDLVSKRMIEGGDLVSNQRTDDSYAFAGVPGPPDWEGIEQRMWRANVEDVVAEARARSARLMKRVELFVWRFGGSVDSVLEKIEDDPMFAAWFAKEPRRQSPHLQIAADYLQQFDSIVKFTRLPQTGNFAFYLSYVGKFLPRIKIRGVRPSTALDFMWESRSGVRCFASHKYAKGCGGNQDGQFDAQRSLLINFQRRWSFKTALFVICDGPYYNERRMAALRMYCRTTPPWSIACHIDEVPSLVAKLRP